MTHRVDAVRYYCVSRVLPAAEDGGGGGGEGLGYDEFMAGGAAPASYMLFGGGA